MQDLLKLQQKVVPELMEVLDKRYNILRTIQFNQPIGRRILANRLGLGERIVRSEINFLKDQNLIDIGVPGMTVTSEGDEIIEKLKDFIRELKGLSQLEQFIQEKLKIKKVIIVSGDAEEDATVMNELGRTAAKYLESIIKDNSIIAVTGGKTIKVVIDNFHYKLQFRNSIVVPARGGMGKNVGIEANTLVEKLANKLGASYRLLHVPENLSDIAFTTIRNEKSIKEIRDILHSANYVIYGIGRADDMSIRRGIVQDKIDNILEKGAVGEAFGYYFNSEGQVVDSTPSIGLTIEEVKNAEYLLAVAAEKSKAEAIVATEIGNTKGVLVTDEGTAREIIKVLSKN